MNRQPPGTNLDLHSFYREGYSPGTLLSTDRSRSRGDVELPEDFGNPLKALEVRELQEEENWIRNLKLQRDKIEEFRAEIEARDIRIRGLEEEIMRLKSSSSQLLKLQAALEKAETQVRIRDKDLALQGEQFKKQLKEYQMAMEDMRETMRQDQDVYQREMQKCRTQSIRDQEELSHLRSEYEKGRGFKVHTEELLDIVRKEAKERESQLQEQLTSSRAIEKQLKDQYSELSYEKAGMEGKIKELFSIVGEQERTISSMKEWEDAYQKAEMTIGQVRNENEKLTYEVALLKEAKEATKTRAEDDFRLLKEDLDLCTALVKRQEQTICELRKRKLDDDSEITSLSSKVSKLQRELASIRDSHKSDADDRATFQGQIKDLSLEMDRLRSENADLGKQLSALIEKEAADRRQKEEYAKMRMELISMRNKEMAAFSDALEGVAGRRFES